MIRAFIRKIKAILLTLVVITALTLFTMLVVGIIFSLMSIEHTITIEYIKASFLSAGCGVGLAAIYKDMLSYLAD